MAPLTSKDKGKGKAATSSDKAAAEPRSKPTFSGPGGAPTVIHYFVEAGNSAVQRGYSQELFQQSYEDLTNAGAKELEDVKKADKAAKEEREEKTKDWSTQIEFIVKELQSSRTEAEDALIKHSGDLNKSLIDLTGPKYTAVQ